MSRTEITCLDCGQRRHLHAHGRCGPCYNRYHREAAKQICPSCGQLGRIRIEASVCGRCRRAARPRRPPAPRILKVCTACGQRRVIQGWGRCARCYQTDPELVHRCAEKLAAQLESPPAWLTGFGAYLAARLAPTRAVGLLHELVRLLAHAGNTPTPVLRAARGPGPALGGLARALEAFFVASRLALPLDTVGEAAAIRRSRRVAEVPATFRDTVAEFDLHQLQSRDRARRAGTQPRSDRTLEINLIAVRDLAGFLAAHRPEVAGWSMIGVSDIEAFLATIGNAGNRGPPVARPASLLPLRPTHPTHPRRPYPRVEGQLQHPLPR